MYIVKEEITKKIAAIFKDKEEALFYVKTAKNMNDISCYIINDSVITEEIYDQIYVQALIESLMNPEIITEKVPKKILKQIELLKLLGGIKNEI